jgi:hypothetical protein
MIMVLILSCYVVLVLVMGTVASGLVMCFLSLAGVAHIEFGAKFKLTTSSLGLAVLALGVIVLMVYHAMLVLLTRQFNRLETGTRLPPRSGIAEDTLGAPERPVILKRLRRRIDLLSRFDIVGLVVKRSNMRKNEDSQ